jgi:hypothetical protein
MVRTPVHPEATTLGPLSAQLRRPKPRSGMSAQRRLRSYLAEGFSSWVTTPREFFEVRRYWWSPDT